jgi:hypothetical protein
VEQQAQKAGKHLYNNTLSCPFFRTSFFSVFLVSSFAALRLCERLLCAYVVKRAPGIPRATAAVPKCVSAPSLRPGAFHEPLTDPSPGSGGR